MGDMLKPKSAAVTKAVEAGLRLFGGHKRGDLVPWPLIERAAGFGRDTQHWTAFMRRVRRDFLRQTGVCLWASPGDGLRLLTVAEQLGWRSAKRQRRGARQMARDAAELAALPAAELTARQAEERARRQEITRAGLRAVRRAARMGAMLNTRPSYMPRPVGGAA